MRAARFLFVAGALVALTAGMAAAQGAIGSEGNQVTESRMPTVLTVEVEDMTVSSFPVDIPFTTSGSAATVYLAVYTNLSDADLPGLTTEGELNWHTYQEIDYALHVSPGSRFEPGSHSITWDGTDMNGNAVDPSGSYRFFIVALDDQAPINMVGYTNARHTQESCLARDQNGDLFILSRRQVPGSRTAAPATSSSDQGRHQLDRDAGRLAGDRRQGELDFQHRRHRARGVGRRRQRQAVRLAARRLLRRLLLRTTGSMGRSSSTSTRPTTRSPSTATSATRATAA